MKPNVILNFGEQPKSKLHAVADYVEQLQGSALRTLGHDKYDLAVFGRRGGLLRFAGDITQEEEDTIIKTLERLGCKSVCVNGSRFAFTGRLRIRLEIEL